MGFLDDESISGTTDVDLGRDYWIKVRNCVPREKMEVAESLLMSATIVREGDGAAVSSSSDTAAYRTYMVAASVVSWNLDDGEGDSALVWPFNNDAAILRGVKRLPSGAFNEVYAVVNRLNSPRTPEEQQRFPGDAAVGDPQQPAGAAVADEVRAGETTLAGPGTEPYGLPAASVA
jgi:hypothetical protein